MKYVWLFLILSVGVECKVVYVNGVVDVYFKHVTKVWRSLNVTYIKLGNVTVDDNMKAYGVKIGDVTKTRMKGDVSLTMEEDLLRYEGAIGIEDLWLVMDKLELDGRVYDKALVVVDSNRLSFTQNTLVNQTYCNQTITGLGVSDIGSVTLYNRPSTKINVTRLFSNRVVPYINRILSRGDLDKYYYKYLDSCSVEASTNQSHLYFYYYSNQNADLDEIQTILEETQDLDLLEHNLSS